MHVNLYVYIELSSIVASEHHAHPKRTFFQCMHVNLYVYIELSSLVASEHHPHPKGIF